MQREGHDAPRLHDEHASEEERARVHVAVEREGELLERALAVERANRRVMRNLLAHHAHAECWAASKHVAYSITEVTLRTLTTENELRIKRTLTLICERRHRTCQTRRSRRAAG